MPRNRYEVKALGGARTLTEFLLAAHTQPQSWQSKNHTARSQIMAAHSSTQKLLADVRPCPPACLTVCLPGARLCMVSAKKSFRLKFSVAV